MEELPKGRCPCCGGEMERVSETPNYVEFRCSSCGLADSTLRKS